MKGGEKSPSAICNIIPRLADTLFPEKMAPRKLPGDVCNNLRAFLLPVSMTTTWHAWRLRNREGRQTLPFSLRQNAFSPIHSNSLTGKHNRAKDQPQQNTDIYPPPPRHCWLYFHCKHQSRLCPLWRTWDTALISSALEDTCHTHTVVDLEDFFVLFWFFIPGKSEVYVSLLSHHRNDSGSRSSEGADEQVESHVQLQHKQITAHITPLCWKMHSETSS